MQLKWITALSLSSVLVACGGGGPDTAKVKADFDSPSGKTSDKDAVIAANSKRTATGGATSAAGALSPIGSFGLLSREASEGPFSRLSIFNMHALSMRSLKRSGPIAARIHAQTDEEDFDFSDCFDPSSVSGSGSGSSASFSYSVDFGSCNSGMTGSMDVDGEFEYDDTFTNGTGTFEMTYNNVCTTATGDCINGVIAMEITQSTDGSSFVIAWDIETSGGELGAIQTRGGMRLAENNGSSEIEYLAYVRDSTGAEVSYVFRLTTDDQGNATVSITGSDGSIECIFNADGSGSCSGDADLSWEAGYEDTIISDPDFAGYDG